MKNPDGELVIQAIDPGNITNNQESPPFTFTKVFQHISGLAIPMALSFTFSFEVFLGVLMLNYISVSMDQTAAATLVSILMNTICVLAMSPLFAVAIDLSNKLGDWKKIDADVEDALVVSQKKEAIASTNANSLLIAGIVSIPAFLGLFFSGDILTKVFQQNPNVAYIAQEFLRPYSIAVPALMARMSFEQIMFSFAKTKPAMWIGLASLVVGGGISALLGFGPKIGTVQIPKLGPTGVAIGFVIESFLTAIAYGFYIGLNKECREFGFFSNMLSRIKNHGSQLISILKTGGAISFTVALELAMVLAVGIFSGLVGVKEQSAMTFNMQFIYFEFIALAAFSFSCTQEISRCMGSQDFQNANRIAKYGLLTTLIYLTPIPLVFGLYPKALEWISGGAEANVSAILKMLVPLMSIGVIIDTIRYNLLQQSRAFNDLLVPNLIATCGLGAGVILSGCLGLKTSLGIYGVAAGYTIGMLLTALPLTIRWLEKSREVEMKAKPSTIGFFSKSACTSQHNPEIHAQQPITPKTPLFNTQAIP